MLDLDIVLCHIFVPNQDLKIILYLYFECKKHLDLTFGFKVSHFKEDFKFPLKVTKCFWCILFFCFFIFLTHPKLLKIINYEIRNVQMATILF